MGIITKSVAFRRDYRDIWNYIDEQGNPDAGSALLKEFDEKLAVLSEHPYVGAARPDLRKRLRSIPVGNYMIFYKPILGGIQLVRVIDCSRDLAKIFKR